MAFLRPRITLTGLALAVALASLGFVALKTIPASSHGNTTVLECVATGIGGDNAGSRAIQFTVSESFLSVDVRMDGSVAGSYAITAELRRSTGFTSPIQSASRSGISLPGTPGTTPYPSVHFDFPLSGVFSPTTFTLKFLDIVGPGSLYIETGGIGNFPCPNMEETEENNVASPTERGDPTGFKVYTLRQVSWADVDCSGGAPNSVDSLKILRYAASLSVSQTQPCPAMGAAVQP